MQSICLVAEILKENELREIMAKFPRNKNFGQIYIHK